jgi:hypothetical protein
MTGLNAKNLIKQNLMDNKCRNVMVLVEDAQIAIEFAESICR